MKIPILSRIHFSDYVNLFMVMITLILDKVMRVFFIFIPNHWLNWFQGIKRVKYRQDIESFCAVEYHYTTTKDGYTLCMHRLSKSDEISNKKVVLLWHGFLMCSEVWVCHPDSIAKYLNELGYDVWLANTRGNKYSKKHVSFDIDSEAFWNFSIDEVAQFDVPAVTDYILQYTKQSKLSYIGFSQGTSQFFAALSINLDLQNKIDKFIALAAVIRPLPLRKTIPASLIQSSPSLLYLLFGRKAIFASAAYWGNTLSPSLFRSMLDMAMNILFGWNLSLMDKEQKVVYFHLVDTL
eukprot:NODE_884_length_3321_cov_0.260708.p1 type:complete len:294 gc:universal NODE_884_length_3321_cov_0.260708:55-936(+)